MLIICNGTFKSGSSWLHAIVLELFRIKGLELSKIPEVYNPNLKSPTRILENKLSLFLNNEDYIKPSYVTKAHYFTKSTLEKNYSENVKFIFIERDIKDAIVSHFHHFNNYRRKDLSFDDYFKFIGVFKAYEMSLFNTRCKQNFDLNFFFSYVKFKSDFAKSVIDLCLVLGITDISDTEILEIKENTSLNKMKTIAKEGGNKYYPELGSDSHKLFRKGNVGDWKEYYIERNLKLVNKVIQLKSPLYVKVGYFFMFTLRRKIGL
tara:strand:+ start:183 stop:971 length:789 start_codon:yes stop_codon:yes gene_type:complete